MGGWTLVSDIIRRLRMTAKVVASPTRKWGRSEWPGRRALLGSLRFARRKPLGFIGAVIVADILLIPGPATAVVPRLSPVRAPGPRLPCLGCPDTQSAIRGGGRGGRRGQPAHYAPPCAAEYPTPRHRHGNHCPSGDNPCRGKPVVPRIWAD